MAWVLVAVSLSLLLAFTWPDAGVAGIRLFALTPLRALPLPVTLLFAFVALAVGLRAALAADSVPPATEGTARPRWLRWLPAPGEDRALRFVALTTAISLLFALPVRYGLLGDNWLRVEEALRGGGNAHERGAIAFYAALVRTFGDGTVEGAAEVFRNVARASGLVAALAWAALSAEAHGLATRRALVVLALFSGAYLIFSAYLEIYAPLLALLLLLAVVSLRATRRPRLVFLPPLLALLVAGFHLAALLWLPMATVPLLAHFLGTERRRVLGLTALTAILGVLVAAWLGREHALFLRFLPTVERPYALLSLAHLADYANAQILGSVAGVLLGLWGVTKIFRGPSRDVAAPTWVALWGWLLPGVGLFLFNPVLGAADWDVLALAAPFGLLLAATQAPLLHARVFPAALSLGLLLGPAWFVLHATGRSVDWVATLLAHDRADYYQGHPPELHFAFLCAANGLEAERLRALEAGQKAHPEDPRFPLGLARAAVEAGRWSEAEVLATQAYGIVRGYLPALDVLYEVFRAQGRRDDQRGAGETILQAAREDPPGVASVLGTVRIAEIERDLARLP